VYVAAVVDIGSMIGLTATANNAGGSGTASADPVGPIVPATP
jgi:hypothetical protein